MIAHGSKNYSIPIGLASLIAGFLLMISGYGPFAILGAGLILFSFFLPFLRLGIKPNPLVVSSGRPAEAETTDAERPAADVSMATVTLSNADEAVQAIEDVLSVPPELREIAVDQVKASSEPGGGVRIVLIGKRGMTKEMIEERYRQLRASSGEHGRASSGWRLEESA